ncbi:MAG TPA: SpoIIE family protein phosphatase [Acidobacteriota bacterium]|nr:SpoIIE family protein phosphatase [Acidobacteriota bacterium]
MEAGMEAYLRAQLLDRRQRLQSAVPLTPDTAPLVRLLTEVDSALESMDRGTYGLCDVCHDPIEKDRLLRDPLLRNCLDHLTPAERRALEQDLELAGKIQGELLPKQDFRSGDWEIYYHYEALGSVSGDYCDLIPANDGCLYFLLGDVSGKGVAASILMSHLHAIFRSLMSVGLPFDQLMERANRVFCDSTASSSFATLVCGKAHSAGVVEICNAGHCPPFLIRRESSRGLEATGLPLGLFCSSPYGVQRLQFERGEGLLLYTDGLTEARNQSGEEYGSPRLEGIISRRRETPPQMLVEACLGDLNHFLSGERKTDDLAIMAVRRASQ